MPWPQYLGAEKALRHIGLAQEGQVAAGLPSGGPKLVQLRCRTRLSSPSIGDETDAGILEEHLELGILAQTSQVRGNSHVEVPRQKVVAQFAAVDLTMAVKIGKV